MKWFFIIPGVYFLGMFFTYWLVSRATPSKTDEDIDKLLAILWPICLPLVLIVIIIKFLSALLDLLKLD